MQHTTSGLVDSRYIDGNNFALWDQVYVLLGSYYDQFLPTC